VFHVGPGGGGKGTLLRAVSDALGEYTSTAARGLITGRGGDDRHPTEIIDLRGRRLVTSHESDQSADLREGFIKQLSGEDPLKGRAMRQDFVEFLPTHKLQMLTNYPPVVQGSDYGIWRRLVLVPYEVKFGSADDVAAGKATQLVDPALPEALRNEREGIFAWLVRGAVEWYRVGLQVPESIRKATDTYQSDQDRAEQFVNDTFAADATAWIANNDIHLYYKGWCVEHGYKPLGWQKLVVELRRIVGQTFVQDTAGRKVGSGATRRTVRGCYGLRLQSDGINFAPVRAQPAQTNPNSDLVGGDQS
jgi:putative DNA primase/helicase